MKKALTLGLVGVALATTLPLVTAGSFNRGPGVDAQTADETAAAAPARAPSKIHAPAYSGVARIIHVPQRGEYDERASVNDRDEPEATGNDQGEPIAPPPRRSVKPRWPQRSDTPRPPPPLAEGPTPIRPTPRFGSKIHQADKLNAPGRAAATPDALPPSLDNSPPTNRPRGN
jgi:hypothetical protein